MSTPIRFLKRIARRPANERKEILESKKAEVLLSVCTHYGIVVKKKADAIAKLLEEVKKIKVKK